jgi:hypothetical protein
MVQPNWSKTVPNMSFALSLAVFKIFWRGIAAQSAPVNVMGLSEIEKIRGY